MMLCWIHTGHSVEFFFTENIIILYCENCPSTILINFYFWHYVNYRTLQKENCDNLKIMIFFQKVAIVVNDLKFGSYSIDVTVTNTNFILFWAEAYGNRRLTQN
jgi:hypothetical protein